MQKTIIYAHNKIVLLSKLWYSISRYSIIRGDHMDNKELKTFLNNEYSVINKLWREL